MIFFFCFYFSGNIVPFPSRLIRWHCIGTSQLWSFEQFDICQSQQSEIHALMFQSSEAHWLKCTRLQSFLWIFLPWMGTFPPFRFNVPQKDFFNPYYLPYLSLTYMSPFLPATELECLQQHLLCWTQCLNIDHVGNWGIPWSILNRQ